MPYHRKRITRRTLGKEPRTMTRTLLDDNVANTASIILVARPTLAASGVGTGDIWENADTINICAPQSVIKYINIRLESGLRDVAPEAPGFVEYAIVIFEENEGAPTVNSAITSNLGTRTLGDICKQLYRGNCIWDGAFAVSREIPRVMDIKIKLPPKFCSNKIGRWIALLKAFRTNDVSDTTSDCRTWYSHMYKVYT